MRSSRPLFPTVIVAAVAVTVLAAGCGGGGSPPTSSARPAAATTDIAANAVAFAACMRSHGLSSYADPQVSQSAGHSQMTISPGGLDPNSRPSCLPRALAATSFPAAEHRPP